MTSGIAEICFTASKHAIQAALAMKGDGYSSKVAVLLPLARNHFGETIAADFERLFEIYTKSEYEMESLNRDDAELAIKCANSVLSVYSNY